MSSIEHLDECSILTRIEKEIKITIYEAGPNFRNSKRVNDCKEGNDIVNLVNKIVDEIKGSNVRIVVDRLQQGYSHKSFGTLSPPILLVNDEVVSQGIVPDKDYLKGRILHEI